MVELYQLKTRFFTFEYLCIMNLTEFQSRIDILTRKLAALKPISFLPELNSLLSTMKRRIFNNGQASDYSKIGNYSEKESYADESAFVVKSAFKPEKRKRAVTKGKSPGAKGTLRTTIDLLSGYSELREIQGFQNNYVDLMYSGSLFLSFTIGETPRSIGIGFINSEDADKAKYNETHFNKTIFKPTNIEKQSLIDKIKEKVRNIVIETLNGK